MSMTKVARRLTRPIATTLIAVAVTAGSAVMVAPTASATTTYPSIDLTRAAVSLAGQSGFAQINPAHLTMTKPAAAVPLTPSLAVVLKPSTTPAFTDGRVMITGKTTDGTVQVVELGGFGVVTNRHDNLKFRYKTISTANTTLVTSADGGMDEKTSTGKIVGHIDPATAIDGTGTHIPASYSYDSTSHEIVVQADTTQATGAVFIDPSWRCWAVAGAYGAGWVVAAAAWIFTDDSALWAAWALRAWFGLSFNAADAVARACTLH